MHLGGRVRAVEDLRDLGERAILVVMEGYCCPLLRREAQQRGRQIQVGPLVRTWGLESAKQCSEDALASRGADCQANGDAPDPRIGPVVP